MYVNRIPDDIIGEQFTQNDANEFEGPFGKQSLKSFVMENPAYYTKLTTENGVSYIMFIDSSKRSCLRIEKSLIKDEWSEWERTKQDQRFRSITGYDEMDDSLALNTKYPHPELVDSIYYLKLEKEFLKDQLEKIKYSIDSLAKLK